MISEVLNSPSKEPILIRPKYLWFLVLGYTMAFFASNWFDPRQIKIMGISTGAGSIIFPLTYLLSDVITEVYGYKNARIAIWSSLLFYLIFLLYGQLIASFLLSDTIAKEALTLFLYINKHIILAAILSYFITETINSYLVAKLKIFFNGKYMGLRFVGSTLTSHVFNELIYAPIAFYGLIPTIKDFIHHIFSSWAFMVCTELILLPLSIRLAKRIKVIEGLDTFDTETNFNPFSLNTQYRKKENRSKKRYIHGLKAGSLLSVKALQYSKTLKALPQEALNPVPPCP